MFMFLMGLHAYDIMMTTISNNKRGKKWLYQHLHFWIFQLRIC